MKSHTIAFSDMVEVFMTLYAPVMQTLAPPLFAAGAAGVLLSSQAYCLEFTVLEHWSSWQLACSGCIISLAFFLYYLGRFGDLPGQIYLLDFAVANPPLSWRVCHEDVCTILKNQSSYSDESLKFMAKITERSGVGQKTSWPPMYSQRCIKLGCETIGTMAEARAEFEALVYPAVAAALNRAALSPLAIDVLVVNCSLFAPVPSLAAMVAQHFGLRSDVSAYNLGGQGCSAGLIGIDLAVTALRAASLEAGFTSRRYCSTFGIPRRRRRPFTALVISTEILSGPGCALYKGSDRSMLMQNVMFRSGASAVILADSPFDEAGRPAKYKLLPLRSALADASNSTPLQPFAFGVLRYRSQRREGFDAVAAAEDEEGQYGVRLSKMLVAEAGKALAANMRILGPQILPWSEKIKYAWTRLVQKKIGKNVRQKLHHIYCKSIRRSGRLNDMEVAEAKTEYVPDFCTAVDRFCVHAGGAGVLEAVEAGLHLPNSALAVSRAALTHFGNTSSSSIWYELALHELGDSAVKNKIASEESDSAGAQASLFKDKCGGPELKAQPQLALQSPNFLFNYNDNVLISDIEGCGTIGGVRRCERILQIAFGSGFKCNSALWLRLR